MSIVSTGSIDAAPRKKRVLIVYAHPEPQSLNGALKDAMREHLLATGHEVEVTDLYAQGWKSAIDADDFLQHDPDRRLQVIAASGRAYAEGALTEDVRREQDKLRWADAVILQFPLWWFSMPAILKGWIDRVYAYGLAYGVGEHSDRRWGDRYGEGSFAGKRAMLSVTAGGWRDHYSARGINGCIDDILFPINHGVLHYPGFDVLPSFVVYRSERVDAAQFERLRAQLHERLDGLWTQAPIPYRQQNAGDYELPSLRLKSGLEAPGTQGFRLHLRAE
ncbi:NAD(P)H-dependent oxidoreductase [Lysobacter firmicutimachus]|uniref:NAD(P)H-dependent oxidoreductase n=1 Tax=Lysobacter firmicutimachus TaxID=1792846 RepID=A0ABU8D212_9GAMM